MENSSQIKNIRIIAGEKLSRSWLLHDANDTLISEGCSRDVGVESGGLPDSALSASSSYDPLNVGPQHARLGQDTAGGAWCPRDPVGPDPDTHQQWLGVNLTQPHVISSVLTQGR